MNKLFEDHFTGPSNAGLRQAIADATDAAVPACADRIERVVRGVASTVALTAQGPTLEAVVQDFAIGYGVGVMPIAPATVGR